MKQRWPNWDASVAEWSVCFALCALLCLLMVRPRLSCWLSCNQLRIKRSPSMHYRQACVYAATRSYEGSHEWQNMWRKAYFTRTAATFGQLPTVTKYAPPTTGNCCQQLRFTLLHGRSELKWEWYGTCTRIV